MIQIYKASMVSMMAGADFIKTSTGKEAVNATLPIGLIMCRAIRKHYQKTGVRVSNSIIAVKLLKKSTSSFSYHCTIYLPTWHNRKLV